MDVRTLFITLTMCAAVSTALLCLLYYKGYKAPGLSYWCMGQAAYAIAICLFTIRDIGPSWLTIYGANIFRALCPLLILEGMRLLFGKPLLSKRRSFVIFLCGFFALYSWYLYGSPSLSARYLITTSFNILIKLAIVRELWLVHRINSKPMLRFMGYVYSFICFGLVVRLLREVYAPSQGTLLNGGLATALHVLLINFEVVVVTVGMAFMLVERLQGRVTALESILPICAYCKKVRDDDNNWTQIECYLSERDSTQFSHGVCPDCEEHLKEDLGEIPKESVPAVTDRITSRRCR